MYKNIVFDMGNVLIKFDPKEYINSYVKEEEIADCLYKEIFLSKEWIQYDRGVINLDGIISAVEDRVEEEYHDYVKFIVSNWRNKLLAHSDMEELVTKLKAKGYKIYLLSNVSKHYYDFRENIPTLKYFDGEFISADYQLIKPEKEIFLEFYKKFNLKPEECFFIDDLALNIEAAEKTGMKGFVYHGNIDKLYKALEFHNILSY